jgi:uncharacterized protein (TIGR03437 family)
VNLTLVRPDPASIRAVVNSASSEPVVSPGAMMSILGTSLGPVLSADYDVNGLYPTTLGNTTVTFNGVAAALLSTSPGRIEAVAPYEIAGQELAQVVVSHYGQSSDPFDVLVADIAPAIFTAGPNGSGQFPILSCAVTFGPPQLYGFGLQSEWCAQSGSAGVYDFLVRDGLRALGRYGPGWQH